MNARELLKDAADWLGWQDEDMSFGLKSGEDALKLFAYAKAHPELPEMADEWGPKDRRKAIGYEPMGRWAPGLPGVRFINRKDQEYK
jgi:hypothetical protein